MEEKTRVSRRSFLRMTAVSAAGVLVAACQPQVVKETVEVEKVVKETVIVEVPKGATEAVTLRYVFVADPGELEVRQACILDFMKKFPEIRIDGELVPEDGMGQKILTQLAGGAAPDMTYYNNTPLPLYATENVLIPLDDYAERDAGTFQPDDFFAGPLADMGYGGKQYGYCSDPLELDTYGSSCRVSPRKGMHDDKATSLQARVESTGCARGSHWCQECGRDLPGA